MGSTEEDLEHLASLPVETPESKAARGRPDKKKEAVLGAAFNGELDKQKEKAAKKDKQELEKTRKKIAGLGSAFTEKK